MSEARVAWRRASRGIYLLGFGVLLLLTTMDFLSWGFWLNAISWWPLILVAAGVRMIFERSAAPWAILLSPAIVFGTLGWVAITTPEGTAGSWGSVVAEAPGHPSSWSLQANAALTEIDIVAGELPEGRLVEGRISPRNDRAIRTREWGDRVEVELSSFRRRGFVVVLPGLSSRSWDLTLSRSLPLSFDLRGAMTEGTIDLGAARLSRIEMDGAFHDLKLRLPRPSGRVGVSIQGAFNELEIMVPPGTPVLSSHEGALNFVDGRERPPPSEGPGYRLHMEGFMNRVRVVDDPSPEPPVRAPEDPPKDDPADLP